LGPTLLERAWEEREEVVFPSMFGDIGPGIYPIPPAVFSDVFGEAADPRWLHVGVFASPPSQERPHWVFVTSGLSNPWESDEPPTDPAEPSWLGVEYVFRCTQGGDWAIRMVQRVAAFALLLAHGRYPGREPLRVGDRIPLRGPVIPASDSALTWLVVCPPSSDPINFRLESGSVEFVQLVAVTDAEANLARAQGLEPLLQVLRSAGAYAVADPDRMSAVAG